MVDSPVGKLQLSQPKKLKGSQMSYYQKPAQPFTSALELYGSSSKCCNAPRRLVRSRRKGFVSQNCTECGNSGIVPLADLPPIECPSCGKRMKPHVHSLTKNYAYRCKCNPVTIELHRLIPSWEEIFEYCGLGLDSDHHRHKQNKEADMPHQA